MYQPYSWNRKPRRSESKAGKLHGSMHLGLPLHTMAPARSGLWVWPVQARHETADTRRSTRAR